MSNIGHFCQCMMGIWKNTRWSFHLHITERLPGEVSEDGVTASQCPSVHSDVLELFDLVNGYLNTIFLRCDPGLRFQAEVIS